MSNSADIDRRTKTDKLKIVRAIDGGSELNRPDRIVSMEDERHRGTLRSRAGILPARHTRDLVCRADGRGGQQSRIVLAAEQSIEERRTIELT